MGKVSLALLCLLIPLLLRAQGAVEKVGEFFQREGYVVKVEGQRLIVDLGKDKVKIGEEFDVLREGKEIVHPITRQVIGREREKVGRIRIEEVGDGFSYARLLEGIAKEGERIRLRVEDLCFEGKGETFFKLRALLPDLKREAPCTYTIREMEEGIGIEHKNLPVAFYRDIIPAKAGLEDINLLGKPRLLLSLPSLPLSADLCDLTGTGREILLVLFSGRVSAYELVKRDLVKRFDYSLPAGVPLGLQCGRIGDGNQDLVLLNMVSGDSVSSMVLKAVGDSLVPIARNIPYFMGVLNKEKPKETFIGQRYALRLSFGQALRLSLEGDRIRELGAFLAPRGFRIDSAFSFGDYLIFTDSTGRIRVFKGDTEVFSTDEGFGGSYTYAEVPLEQGKMNFVFNPRGSQAKFMNFPVSFVIKNHTGVVQRFLDILKYTRGELFLVGEKRRDLIFIRPLRGGNFEESIQAVLTTRDGRILVLTGRTGTIALQNRGDVYELELRGL
ncbi:MAG: hypothetical protein ACK4OF_04995 [Aquificaceae bacterium]